MCMINTTKCGAMAKLYLECCSLEKDNCLNRCLSFSSTICMFVYAVLISMSKGSQAELSVSLVKCSTDRRHSNSSGGGPRVNELCIKECPHEVNQVKLPVLVTNRGKMIHCGLCSVLRRLVKLVHTDNPNEGIHALLGHHEMCLRSCAEVSLWTKFCEVDLPTLVRNLNCQREYTSTGHKDVPEELLKFENHLRQPAVIPQINRRKQQIYKLLTSEDKATDITENWISSLNGRSLREFVLNCDKNSAEYSQTLKLLTENKKLQSNVRIPGLDHTFAEGADVTLTDLVLLPSFTCVLNYLKSELTELQNTIPHVLRWYQKLTSIQVIREALHNAGLPLVMTATTEDMAKETYHQNSLQRCQQSALVKHKIKVSTSTVDAVLQKIQACTVLPEESPHPSLGSGLKWDDLPAALHPAQGNLPSSRVSRKCEQLENLALAIKSLAKPGDVIVDFCAGGGHLGIVVAYLLPKCQVLLVENKEESITRALGRIEQLELKNIRLYQSNLDYFTGSFNIGTCLHACGVATDLVLHKCLQNSAAFVVCPCCYGAIQNTHTLSYPQSQKYKDLLTYQDHILLARAADDEKTGKQFMVAVDADRAEHAKDAGYKVDLHSLHPLSCSPKNNLLIGWKV